MEDDTRKSQDMCKPQYQRVVSLTSVICLLLGFILGSRLGSRALQDFIDGYYGYRWNYLEKCIIGDETFAGGYCRAPKTCTCNDVDHIDIVEYFEMTEDRYEEKYAQTNRPVIIRNVSSEWAAMDTVDFGWLRDRYLASEDILKYEAPNCFFKCYKTNEFKSLSDLFRISPDRVTGGVGPGARPWYVGWSVCHEPVMAALSALVTLPPFLARYEMIGNMWVFVGSPGYGAHLHLDDDLDTNTWQAQISGVKTWILEPPPECRAACPGQIRGDLHPGDMIIVNTNFWMHKTEVLDHGISLVITQQIG